MKFQPSLELLEARIAPATLVSPTTVTFSDIDGDDVTIRISKPLFTADNLNQVISFSDGTVRLDGTTPQFLSNVFVKNFGAGAAGLDITITSKRSAVHGGNGAVDVGGIDAFTKDDTDNFDLGKVRVTGDLRFIDAGDGDFSTPALKSLDVFSIGESISSLTSEINGSIGVWKVRGNMQGALVQTGPRDEVHAGTIFIGGSLGRIDAQAIGSGSLLLAGDAGSITIGHDLVGGAVQQTGSITVGGALGSLKIGGSARAGDASLTAFINVGKDAGSVRIGGDLAGGPSQNSGFILISGQESDVGSIQIRGSIIGGHGPHSGSILVGHARSIVVGHDLIGTTSDASGSISGRILDQVRIGGSMIGAEITGIPGQDSATGSASIFAFDSIGSVTVGGDVVRANIVAGIKCNVDLEFGRADDPTGEDLDISANVLSRIARITIKGAVNSGTSGHYAIEANSIGALRIGGINYLHTDPTIDFAAGFEVDASQRFTVREL